MPFGLKNAGMTFQRLIDRAFADLDHTFGYLDDLLVASPDEASHALHLRQVFERLRQFGLVLHVEKCIFAATSMEYLGHSISEAGLVPLRSNLAAILDHSRPVLYKELQGYLGMLNFYRRFIPSAATLLLPLTDSLKGNVKGSAPVTWSPSMDDSFNRSKAALAKAVTLGYPSSTAEWAPPGGCLRHPCRSCPPAALDLSGGLGASRFLF